MSQEILGKLQRIQQQAEQLSNFVASLQAGAPQGADGYDATEQVRVEVGADGLPTGIRVESGWQDRLGPHAVGQAVVEAFAAAVANGMRAWSDSLAATSWHARAAELDAQGKFPAASNQVAFSPPAVTGSAGRRDPQEVAEDVLRASERLRQQTAAQALVGVGTDVSRNVAVTLSR
ncbi:hypothetical protein GCM10022251_74240 [Phytohabitans flavus]|uniref:YbaB/EbfC DNA-binding family protein n=1 Tax=Phytohabitans flavus TaxID=1076124 RepID=A0A6F8XL12_9ACTN|nr:hypothetical protein [Phytohabitans flavus]BCB74502.1 hypothetical protein Pflav_009120 [Phytohabitans flavus]